MSDELDAVEKTRSPTSRGHYDVLTKTRSKLTAAISFSRQNDTDSLARALSLLEKRLVLPVLAQGTQGKHFQVLKIQSSEIK